MKYYTIFFSICILLMGTRIAVAQDTDDDQDKWESPVKVKVGGAGGFTPSVGFFDNAELDKNLQKAGLPTLGSDPMYLMGGAGYGYIMFLKNVRFGGWGIGGKRSVDAIDTTGGGRLKKSVDYNISYGGFTVDYVYPIADRLELAVGFSIGGGSVDITMKRDNGAFKDWNGIWTEFGKAKDSTINYTRRMTGAFATFTPNVQIEYALLRWLQLRVGVGFPIMFSPEWKLDDSYEITNVPAAIKAKGYTINTGLMFGFFN